MNFSFKNLLAKILRPTRWGEFLEVIQDVIREIKADKMDRIKHRINLDLASSEDLISFIAGTGFKLPTFEGYTSSLYYYRERAKSIIYEIKTKLSVNSIRSIYKGFLVYGDAYRIQKVSGDFRWDSVFDDISSGLIILDREVDSTLLPLFLDKTTTSYPITERWTSLDQDVNKGFTSQLLLSYYWVFAENTTQFWSAETARAFYLTMRQNKRKRDFYRFQPWLKINLNNDNTAKTYAYPVYTRDASALQKSILISGDLSDITRIDLGTGAQTVIDLSITGCQSTIETYTVGGDYTFDFREVKINNHNVLNLEYTYTEWTKVSDSLSNQILTITECAIFDSGNNIVAYATFPEVNFITEMLNTLLFEFNIVTP